MTPTLVGRLQTRLLLMLVIGLPWTLVLATLLGTGLGAALGMVAVVTVLGLLWEAVYHALQQLRWDKDWPSLLALLAGIPEGLVAWAVLAAVGLRPGGGAVALLFGTTWLLLWLVQQGPLRVLAPGWRFHGARFLEPRPEPVRPVESPAALDELLTPTAEPEPEPEPEPVRAAAPRKVRTPLTLPGRRLGVALLAAAVLAGLGWSISTTVGKEHHGSARAQADRPATASTPPEAPAGSPAPRAQDAAPAPAAQQPVKWQVPSDHKAYRTWDAAQRITPYAVTIPRLQLQTLLGSVGLSPTGTIQTPAKASEAAWYDAAAAPGQTGPAVLVGSMSDKGAQHGVFAQVGQLVPGDTVVVTRTDSTSIQFIVDKVQQVPFAKFPTRQVYGMTDKPTLRLIGFSKAGKASGTNVIVFAKAVRLLQPKQAS